MERRIMFATISYDSTSFSYQYANQYSSSSPVKASGYCLSVITDAVKEHGCMPGSKLYDWRTTTHANAVTLALRGPMPNPTLPNGTIHGLGDTYIPVDKSALMYGASAFDEVSMDIYEELCTQYGVRVHDLQEYCSKWN